MGSKVRGRHIILAFALAAITAGLVALLGGVQEERTLTPKDATEMRGAVEQYWAAKQHVWPMELRGTARARLPEDVKERMRAERRAVADRITTDRLAAWERSFDPGGFLEEQRASGSVITGSGFEIVSVSEPVLVAADTAQVDVVVRSWSEEYEPDASGKPRGKPHRAENVVTYRYTFKDVSGTWRIAIEDLMSNPL